MRVSRLKRPFFKAMFGKPTTECATQEAQPARPKRRNAKFFLYITVIPSLLCIVYFGFIETDRYLSESRFVVRQQERKSTSSLGVLLQSVGITSAREEAFTAKDFVLSRDALRLIDNSINLRAAFTRDGVDPFSRFNPLNLDDSFEELFAYYSKRVRMEVDLTSSIAILKVEAFTPEDATRINTELLLLAEGLINKLNERARTDTIAFAAQQVEEAEVDAKASALALSAYRDQETLFDPAQQSTMQLQQVFKLQAELITVRGHIAQFRESASESPQMKALQRRAHELQKEIDNEMAKVTGGSDSITQKVIEFERLMLDRDFSDKRLSAALGALEQARSEAQRQQLYLERIVAPNLPDTPIYPKRIRNILTAVGVLIMLYGVVKILMIGLMEHSEQ
ncbi:putative lipopolysaccharide biosynthesis protein [Megalodesulfovibrio gigas DSM 1382 = ATCC 19364]|uniref:Putative lipopolysaccharide biosynthesis protein n=2 Tax=Megalodesulfovibrio gigas TaxID=879 RepID=T2G8V9_MEGG1|nr:putative lipopolysaccharide biosynthesis protein [Megalodesulfovibrio gigas DSM 1382 = ATCC 19364]